MKEIIVTTQTELDALPEIFGEPTLIKISGEKYNWLTLRKAWGNSSVEAWGNSVVRVFSAIAKLLLHGFSVAFLPITINLNIEKKSKNAHVQVVKDLGWFERNAVEPTKIEIALTNLHEWKDNPQYPYKIGFREGVVLFECDRFGKKLAETK